MTAKAFVSPRERDGIMAVGRSVGRQGGRSSAPADRTIRMRAITAFTYSGGGERFSVPFVVVVMSSFDTEWRCGLPAFFFSLSFQVSVRGGAVTTSLTGRARVSPNTRLSLRKSRRVVCYTRPSRPSSVESRGGSLARKRTEVCVAGRTGAFWRVFLPFACCREGV